LQLLLIALAGLSSMVKQHPIGCRRCGIYRSCRFLPVSAEKEEYMQIFGEVEKPVSKHLCNSCTQQLDVVLVRMRQEL
jgi:hypothetical protein